MIKHTATVEIITPEQAERIAQEEGFSNQRKKSANHIRFLKEVMLRGEFDGGEPIRFAAYAGARFLVNGQHRLEAIAESGKAQEMVVVTSHCDTAEEAALLYARIDRGRGRNVADALQALAVVDTSGLNMRQLIVVMSCAPMFATDLRGVTFAGNSYFAKSAEGRAEVMGKWLDPSRRYFEAVADVQFGNDREFIKREVVAVGIVTFTDLPASEKAFDFWNGMAKDDGLASTDPRKQCLEFLKKQRGGRGPRHSPGVGYVAHGVTVCWNAWMRGASLKTVKVVDSKSPLRISGTRYARRLEDGSLDTSRPVAQAPSRPIATQWYGNTSEMAASGTE